MIDRRRTLRAASLAVVPFLFGAAWLLSQSSTQTTLRNPPPQADAVLLFTLGIGDMEVTKWDGAIEVENGELVELVGYEMRVGDVIHPPRRWDASTQPAFPFRRRPHDEGWIDPTPAEAYLTPRFYVYLNGGAATEVKVNTEQGGFTFFLREIPRAGAATFLDGRVSVERSLHPMLAGRSHQQRGRLTDNDYPSVTVATDNSLWVAWQGFDGTGEQVYAEKLPAGRNGSSSKPPHEVSEKGADVFRTAIAEDSEGKIWVVWSQRVDDNWDLFARSFDGQAWSGVTRLTNASQPDTQHQLARAPDRRLHLIWQGYRNNRAAILHKEFDAAGGWSQETRVSAVEAPNCWEPSLAIDRVGNLHVAWDQYGPRGYDIWMRTRRASGWAEPLGVATTARFEAHVSVAADQENRVWLAWHESGVNWGKDWGYPYDITANATGLYNSREIHMAVYDGNALRAPLQSLGAGLPEGGVNFYEFPQLAVDGSNRVWALFRHRRPAQHDVYSRSPSHHALWEIYASYFENGRWSPVMLVPYSTGRNDMRVATAVDTEGRLVAAWPTDRRNFRDFVNLLPDVFAARFPLLESQAAAAQLQAYQSRDAEAAPVHENENADVRRIRDYAYVVNGKTYRIYRGDMHRHTEISWDGYNDGSVEDAYRYAIDAAQLDFLAVTEHNFGIEDEYDWWRSQKAADLYRIGNTFVPLFAYERSVPYPNGHRNIVFPYRGAPVLDVQHYEWNTGADNFGYTRQGPERLFGYLRKYNGIAMPHTSGTSMGTDWADYDPEVEPLVEIYQSDRTSYECTDCWRAADPNVPKKQYGGYYPEGFVSAAWEKGYRLGVQASSDHLGVHSAYSMILAEENSRESLVEAIRSRRAYGATDNIIVDFRLVDSQREYLMGEEATVSSPPRFRIHVEGTTSLRDVEVVKDNKMVYAHPAGAKAADFEYSDNELPGEEASFYYVRVRQSDKDQQIAWSSPIWVTGSSR